MIIPGLGKDERPIGWSQDQKAIHVRTASLPPIVYRVELATGVRRQIFALTYVRQLTNLYLVEE